MVYRLAVFMCVCVIVDIELIAFALDWHLGLAERIVASVLLLTHMTILFVCVVKMVKLNGEKQW